MQRAVVPLPGRGTRAEIVRGGRGPALVYLHGAFGPEWSSALVEELADSFDVIAPSLPGYGESDGLETVTSFWDVSTWLEEVLDATGVEATAVVGHDFGGAVAAEFAALFRRRVSRLALVAPLGLWIDDTPVADPFGLTPGALTRVLFASDQSAAALAFNSRSLDKAEATREILRRRQALIAAAKLLWPIPDKGLRRRLYRIQAPTLVVGGDDDRMTPPAYPRLFGELVPGATVAMVPGGHMLPAEATGEVAAAIRGFAAGA